MSFRNAVACSRCEAWRCPTGEPYPSETLWFAPDVRHGDLLENHVLQNAVVCCRCEAWCCLLENHVLQKRCDLLQMWGMALSYWRTMSFRTLWFVTDVRHGIVLLENHVLQKRCGLLQMWGMALFYWRTMSLRNAVVCWWCEAWCCPTLEPCPTETLWFVADVRHGVVLLENRVLQKRCGLLQMWGMALSYWRKMSFRNAVVCCRCKAGILTLRRMWVRRMWLRRMWVRWMWP